MLSFDSVQALSAGRWAQVTGILQAALAAVEPRQTVRAYLSNLPDAPGMAGQVRVVAFGKAAEGMLLGAVDALGSRVNAALAISKHPTGALPGWVTQVRGDHPVPGEGSVRAGQAVVDFLSAPAGDGETVLVLISGGGSALVTQPVAGVTLADLQSLTGALLRCGASINEINCLRKHLDLLKGGGLVRLAGERKVFALVLSDVVGSPLDVIASGPTVPDSTTYVDALEILRKYGLEATTPAAICAVLAAGARGEIPETPKPADPLFAHATTQVIASNRHAALAALQKAREVGFQSALLTTSLQGEAAAAGGFLAGIAQEIATSANPLMRPACLIAGGETTVTLRGTGTGGRNLEVALGALSGVAGCRNVAIITLATDGEDGPTDAAGAVVTGESGSRAAHLGVSPADALQRNDSYLFFTALGDLVKMGPTGTNVNDLVFVFAF